MHPRTATPRWRSRCRPCCWACRWCSNRRQRWRRRCTCSYSRSSLLPEQRVQCNVLIRSVIRFNTVAVSIGIDLRGVIQTPTVARAATGIGRLRPHVGQFALPVVGIECTRKPRRHCRRIDHLQRMREPRIFRRHTRAVQSDTEQLDGRHGLGALPTAFAAPTVQTNALLLCKQTHNWRAVRTAIDCRALRWRWH